ncbi:MAG TPA: TolC family protein, partial [Gemmatimonadales bacterium]|nr:TolC family protein [Gemmatimonadales bacterium]
MKARAFTTLVAALVMPRGLFSQDNASPQVALPLEQAVAQVRAANPMLRAARLRAEAAWERVPQAAALPDPEVSFGL